MSQQAIAEVPSGAGRDTFIQFQYDDLAPKSWAHAATIGRGGAPQVNPVWIDCGGTHVRCNAARGPVKDKNLQTKPQIALSIQDPANPYRYLQIRARVVEVTEKGADDHIDSLAKKYTGQERYAHRRPGEVRITVKVLPEKIQSMG